MSSRARAWLIAVGALCGVYGLASIAIYLIYVTRHPFQDWMVYYAAARTCLDGNLPLLFDSIRFTAHLNVYFADWLTEPFAFRSWAYPPPFLLLLIPFGLLGFAASGVLFLAATFAGLLAAVWRLVGGGPRLLLYAASLLLAPATWFNIVSGQNGFLSGALLVGGVAALPRRPALAGILLGFLGYKPQLWLLVPVALVAARQWRALAAAIATGAGMALGSLAVVGIEAWVLWTQSMVNPPPQAHALFLECCRLHDESVFTNLALLGASKTAADLGQAAAILLAGACVWWCYGRPLARDLQLAVLLAATMLAAPHVTNYDAVLLVVAATLVFAHGLDHGFRIGGVIVPLLVWGIQLFNPPDAFPIGHITPVLTMLLIACAIMQARAAASAEGDHGCRPGFRGIEAQ